MKMRVITSVLILPNTAFVPAISPAGQIKSNHKVGRQSSAAA